MLLRVDLENRRVIARLPLSGVPADLDINGDQAAVTEPDRNVIVRVSLAHMAARETDVGVPCGTVRFRRDGRAILAAATSARQIVSIDAEDGRLLTRMPIPLAPARFCFNADGGQMFVTGEGGDALTIISPFQNEVDQTILAGRSPAAMAFSERGNLLFVTNPESGDLTILDVETRAVLASVHVGERPGEVILTPDGEYALVVDQRSGNVSVVRVATVLDKKNKVKPLFTVFPMAADARSALIVPFQSE
jgi:YVTN family beta-propeller protein